MKGPIRTQDAAEGWARYGARLCIAALCAFFIAVVVQDIWSVDVWWQMSTGRWILEHRTLPSHDEFSYTVPQHRWIEMRWVYCVAAYLLWKLGGAAALVL